MGWSGRHPGLIFRVAVFFLRRSRKKLLKVMTRNMRDRKNVLLIDCDPVVCQKTEKALRETGYEVRAVSSAAAARNMFLDEQQEIDVVLIDVISSDEIGPVLTSQLHCIRPDVVFLFYTELATELEIFDTTIIRGLVPKGLTKQQLSEALEKVFLSKAARK